MKQQGRKRHEEGERRGENEDPKLKKQKTTPLQDLRREAGDNSTINSTSKVHHLGLVLSSLSGNLALFGCALLSNNHERSDNKTRMIKKGKAIS
jgi:hypothetical protein